MIARGWEMRSWIVLYCFILVACQTTTLVIDSPPRASATVDLEVLSTSDEEEEED